MKFLGLHPQDTVARSKTSPAPVHCLCLHRSLFYGSVGFAVVSLVVFGSWGLAGRWMYRHLTELGAYAVWAGMFIGGSGVIFGRLLPGPGRMARGYAVFLSAFLIYAILWTGAWVVFRNKAGEWSGSLAGTAGMSAVLCATFAAGRHYLKVAGVLFLAHSAGYFIGEFFWGAFEGMPGKLLWGACYGLGFGAGMGYAIHTCLEETRALLSEPPGTPATG